MLTTFKATAKKLPEGLQVETAARGFKIMMDEPEDLGGTDTAMNPVEAVLCALGACQSIVAAAFAEAGVSELWTANPSDFEILEAFDIVDYS